MQDMNQSTEANFNPHYYLLVRSSHQNAERRKENPDGSLTNKLRWTVAAKVRTPFGAKGVRLTYHEPDEQIQTKTTSCSANKSKR